MPATITKVRPAATPKVHVLCSLLLLAGTILLFETTDLDLRVQRYLFDADSQRWLWDRDEPMARLFLYDGVKVMLGGYVLMLGVLLVSSRFFRRLRGVRRPLWVALLVMASVPSLVGILKSVTDVPCPADLHEFGGVLPYVRLISRENDVPFAAKRQRCFPAGHASGGFALLGMVTLFRKRRGRVIMTVGALAVGSLMGGYKMLIGDHFLSHTIITMLLAWLVTACWTWLLGAPVEPVSTGPARPPGTQTIPLT